MNTHGHGLEPPASSVGVACERIFKIKAIEAHRPMSEKELSLGFIGFKRTQAFYVLAQYPALEAYFVSNQYAVPFGRNAICGLVPARLFEVVDLYSSDSTKVPVTTESEKQQQQQQQQAVITQNANTSRLSMASIPSPPLSAATANPTRVPLYTVGSVAVDGFHRANNEYSISVAAYLTMANGSNASARMERTLGQLLRFHTSLVQLKSSSQPVPQFPARPAMSVADQSNPTFMRNAFAELRLQLQVFLNECIANGFTDNLTVFLIPPNGSVQIIAESALSSRNESDSSIQSMDSTTNYVQSPDLEDTRRLSTITSHHQHHQHRPSNPAIPTHTTSSNNNRTSASQTLSQHSRHDSIYSLLSESQRASLIGNDLSQRASYLSEQARQSLISDAAANRASIASLSDYQRLSLIESTVSNNNRDSVVSNISRHNSVMSKNSNRFSISSRRGSAYVGISTQVEDKEDAAVSEVAAAAAAANNNAVFSPPPKAPITQFGANGPVRSGIDLDGDASLIQQPDGEYHGEDKSKRRREISDASAKRFGTMLLAAAAAEEGEQEGESTTTTTTTTTTTAQEEQQQQQQQDNQLVDGLAKVHIEGRGRNAIVNAVKPTTTTTTTGHLQPPGGHEIPFPARSSSKSVALRDAAGGMASAVVDPNLLKHEVNAINSFFDEDDDEPPGNNNKLLVAPDGVRKVASNVSLAASITGRSSSLGWKQT
ncbi:hypothetical protein BJ741DRAFT_652269 [Chytriomyces cf. hyalinus JEL632]|nr:hypothetical protein BJ741DRAFT_652269 [Chytriomyces cf. hyalinus JEL632]